MTENLGDLVGKIMEFTFEIFDNAIVVNVLDFMSYLGMILTAIGILFSISSFAISQIEGNPQDFGWFLRNVILGIIIAILLKDAAIQVFSSGSYIQNQLNNLIAYGTEGNVWYMDVSLITSSLSNAGIQISVVLQLIYTVIFLYLVYKVIFSLYKRTALYFLQLCIGFLHLFSIPSGKFEGFFSWAKIDFGMIGANILQGTTYLISCQLFHNINISNPIPGLIGAIALLIAAAEVDKLFMYFGLQPSYSPRAGVSKAVYAMNSVVRLVTVKKILGK
jgi:hypothetical protein